MTIYSQLFLVWVTVRRKDGITTATGSDGLTGVGCWTLPTSSHLVTCGSISWWWFTIMDLFPLSSKYGLIIWWKYIAYIFCVAETLHRYVRSLSFIQAIQAPLHHYNLPCLALGLWIRPAVVHQLYHCWVYPQHWWEGQWIKIYKVMLYIS